MTTPCLGPDPNPRPPKFAMPAGACDTHAHVIGAPEVHPYVAERSFTPPPAPLDAYLALHRALGIERAVIVQPSVHGTDNQVTLEAIAGYGPNARGIAVVDDACHALGTGYRGGDGAPRRVGDAGDCDMAVFSFHPVKTIAMGEGGAITTNDAGLDARLRRLRSHGIVRDPAAFENPQLALDGDGGTNPWYHEMPELGFNYRASDIHCALGLSQLGKLDRFVAKRRELAAGYDRAIARLGNAVRPVSRVANCRPAWHLYAVLIDFAGLGVDRAAAMRALAARGIGTQVHFIPLHLQPYYRHRYGTRRLPGAETYYRRVLSLPLHCGMAPGDVERVVDGLAQALGLGAD